MTFRKLLYHIPFVGKHIEWTDLSVRNQYILASILGRSRSGERDNLVAEYTQNKERMRHL